MNKIYIFFSLTLLVANQSFSQSGNVTLVSSHDTTQLTWYGDYSELTSFPDNSKQYQQILMDFTLGCSDGGCSHWDYTVTIQVGKPTGVMDSTISHLDTLSYQALELDTISTNPLELDTVSTNPLIIDTLQAYVFVADTFWNPAFEVMDWYELGRMITPYGNYMDYGWGGNAYGFDETWKNTWTYDVTMMEPLLHNNVPVRISFSGWPQAGRGFSAGIDFKFIEGTPTKKITNIQKVYSGGTYSNSTQFEQDVLPSKSISVDASNADLRMIITGHQQDGEFSPIAYKMYGNSTLIREEPLWRTDCSENPLSPQGGTWILSRSNWCPGDDVEEHWFEMTPFIQNGNLNLDANFDVFSPGAASYTISGYLFEYETVDRLYDVAINKIITPNNKSEYHTILTTGSVNNYERKVTTICTNPKIEIKNLGKAVLNYCQIEYGVEGGTPFYFEWVGSLNYGGIEEVVLPIMNWNGLDTSQPKFYAIASYPNHLVDQFAHNNEKEVIFALPKVYDDGNIKFRLRTNNKPEESSYKLLDANSNVILDLNNFTASTTNDTTILLADGCYKLIVLDEDNYFFDGEGGDGLAWWVNIQNNLESSGYFEILNANTNSRLAYFNPDFGRKIEYDFMIGEALNEQTTVPNTPLQPEQAGIEEIEVNGEIYFFMPDSGLYFSETKVGTELDQVLGIRNTNFDDDNLKIYPNPNNGLMTILIQDEKNGKANMIVYNTLGKVIDTEKVVLNQEFKYQTNNRASGIYFVLFDINGKKIVKKISVL